MEVVNPLVLAGVRLSRGASSVASRISATFAKDPTYNELTSGHTDKKVKEKIPCLQKKFLCCSYQNCLFPFSRRHKTSKLYQITCGFTWVFVLVFFLSFFSYVGVGLDYYQLLACKGDDQTCYKIAKVQPSDMCPSDNVVNFQVFINLNIPSKNGIAIGEIRKNIFSQVPDKPFGSLDMDVKFHYPDGHESSQMNGLGRTTTFQCIVDGKFNVTDEQVVANVFSSMMNAKYFDVSAELVIPIIITGFWPFTFTYNFNYPMTYRCEKGFAGDDPLCWMPPIGATDKQYQAAKLAIYKNDLAFQAKWKKINPAPKSTILSVNAAGLTPTNSSIDIASTAQVNATLSINMGGNFIVADVPYMTAKVYMSANNIDPFSTDSPNVNTNFEPVIEVLINPFRLMGLTNGGPFNVTALASMVAPTDRYKIDTLRTMLGLYLNMQNIYLYVQGNSDPVNDDCLVRRVFSKMPPWTMMMNSTGPEGLPNIAMLSGGDMDSYCQADAQKHFAMKSVEVLGMNGNVLTIQATVSYPFAFSMSGFAPPVGFLVSLGESNHTVAKVEKLNS